MQQIGMGEPVKEEVEKLKVFLRNFAKFTKTKQFILLITSIVILLVLTDVMAVLTAKRTRFTPPQIKVTPTPISFPTQTPLTLLPPLSSEAATLTKELAELNYNDPNLTLPNLDWKITLK